MSKFTSDLQKIRERITALRSRIDHLGYGKVPLEVAKESIDRFVDQLATEGDPSVRNFAYGDFMLRPDKHWLFQFIVWLNPDQVRERLYQEVSRCYEDGDPGLPHAQRATEQHRLEKELFDLEVEEERLILRAAEVGVALTRRGDANPAAVLEA